MKITKNTTIKRITSMLLSAAMMISSVQSVFAVTVESFTDFPTGWSRPAMEAAVNNGLLVGFENNEIRPKNNLTRAEMAAIISRAFGAITMADISAYNDVPHDTWYFESVAKAVQMGAMVGKSATQMCPVCNITREEAFSVIGRILALSDEDTSVLSKFHDAANVSSWAAKNVAALVKRGYVNGDNYGNLNPKANITREEFAQVMYTTIKRYITEAGTYSEDMQGIVVLRTGKVSLLNMSVTSDLVVGDGAMKDAVQLTNVNVNGRFLTRGGTMTLKNTTVSDGVVVLNPNGITHFNNYKSETVFKNIIEMTEASFLKRVSGGSSGGWHGEDTITVTFYRDYGEYATQIGEKELVVNNGVATMTDADMPSYQAETVVFEKSNYMPAEYLNLYQDDEEVLKVTPTFWYEVGGKLVPFAAPVELTEDTNVYLMYQNFALNASITDLPDVAISAKYDENSRIMNSAKVLGNGAVNWLDQAKGFPRYQGIVDLGIGALVDRDIIDANRNLKMLYFPAKISVFTDEGTTRGMVNTKFRNMVKDDLDELLTLLKSADIDALKTRLGLSSTDDIEAHINSLNDTAKENVADHIYDIFSSAYEYNVLIDDLFEEDNITISMADINYAKALSYAIRDLSIDDALDFTHNQSVGKLIDFLGEDFITDKFNETKNDYCDGLNDAIEAVENGLPEEEYTTSLTFKINPVEDVLKKLYNDDTIRKVEEKLRDANVHYGNGDGENKYLWYIVNHDIIGELLAGGDVGDELTGYKLKDEVDYAKYAMKMLIAIDDALCWYGDDANLTDDQVNAIIDAIFARVQSVHARINAFLEEYRATGELPGGLNELIEKVDAINNIFTKLEPKLRSIIDKYLANSINDKIEDGSLIENEKVLTAIDIMLGQEDPTFTIDSLYDIFWQYDEKMQSKLKELVDSGKLEAAIDKISSRGERFETLANELGEIIENIADNGIDAYKVNTDSMPTVIDKYEFELGGNTFSITRALQ